MDNSHRRSNHSDVTAALKPLALAATGMTGADIERLLREARQKARRERRALGYEDVHKALTSGQRDMPTDLRRRIAVHEAGHALVWTIFDIGIVKTVTIGHSSGGLVQTEIRPGLIKDEQWINQLIAIALAGQAAEKVVFGSATAGSGGHEQSDLARATTLATDAETSLGFGKVHPLLYRPVEQNPSALSVDRDLARQVHDRLLAAEKLAHDVLSRHREALLALATRLAEATVLEGDEVRAVLADKMSVSR
ncbi:MAG: ATP-dependent Zn protease [Rhizobiales bacterium]|nr:ATP-dependent Zn protease [Hyphomicrobiales bacterium]|tara:strand:+ start:1060 stop:1812 length:753 start_codon:yes stop_codon:yes gene_type:complete